MVGVRGAPALPPLAEIWRGLRPLQTSPILNTGNMKYHIVTLGCPKNIVDSEGMGGILAAQGHTSVAQAGDADVVIVNTCSFIAAARDETLGVLRAMADGKTPGQKLVAAGCMAESHGALVGAVPGVDAILSTREWMKIGDLLAAGGQEQESGDRDCCGIEGSNSANCRFSAYRVDP